jgi:hypothetical protein
LSLTNPMIDSPIHRTKDDMYNDFYHSSYKFNGEFIK